MCVCELFLDPLLFSQRFYLLFLHLHRFGLVLDWVSVCMYVYVCMCVYIHSHFVSKKLLRWWCSKLFCN